MVTSNQRLDLKKKALYKKAKSETSINSWLVLKILIDSLTLKNDKPEKWEDKKTQFATSFFFGKNL